MAEDDGVYPEDKRGFPPEADHHAHFNKALKAALRNFDGDGGTYRVVYTMDISPNPGWVLRYGVDLEGPI